METCLHLVYKLGSRFFVKRSQIQQHEQSSDLLTIECDGWKVISLKTTNRGLQIPKVVCMKDVFALVLDVTSRYKIASDNALWEDAEKIDYY